MPVWNLSIISLVLSFLVLFIGRRVFRFFGLLDDPLSHGHQRSPIPYSMGINIALVFCCLSFFHLPLTEKNIALITGAGLISCMGFIDDWKKLSPLLRLGVQIVLASWVAINGLTIPALSNPFASTPFVLDSWSLEIFSSVVFPLPILLSIIWIVVVVNAVNWLDGSPGIVSSTSFVSCLVYLLLAIQPQFHEIDQSMLIVISSILATCSFTLALFDFPRPLILIGDSGTMFLGFSLACMAILSGGKFATAIIVLIIPLFDALWTFSRRVKQKKAPWKGDLEHFHHDLLKAGYSPRQIVGIFSLIALISGSVSLNFGSLGKLVIISSLFTGLSIFRIILYLQKKS